MIALLHPGEMGAALGASLAAQGHRVTWASAGRSERTRARAKAAGLAERGSLGECLRDAEIVLAVCPPRGAIALARAVAGEDFRGVYADLNAISPASAREIARSVAASGARYVDGSVIGLPPGAGSRPKLYLSGAEAPRLAALFGAGAFEAVVLGGGPTSASALKICDSIWARSATALLACVRELARHEGVEEALLAQWERAEPGLARRSERIFDSARKGWRFAEEMEQTAAALADARLPDEIALGAAEVWRRFAHLKDAPARPTAAAVAAALRGESPGMGS